MKHDLKKRYRRVYEKCLLKANKIVPNKNKVSKSIKKARKVFDRLHNIPRFKPLSINICNFCDLLSDYFDGIYPTPPIATIIALLGGILYLILPIDALADFIPLIGLLDDAAVLAFVLNSEQNDIDEYLEWKKALLLDNEANKP